MAAKLFAGATLLTSVLAVPTFNTFQTSAAEPVQAREVLRRTPPSLKRGGEDAHLYHSPAWLPQGQDLRPSLSQYQTNGKSKLGTFDAPTLPQHLPGEHSAWESPWGGRTAKDTNAYHSMPLSNVTRKYDFTITYQNIAPDGVTKAGLVVNGAFPGPTIEANWGDWIEVTVHNALPDEGTSFHWHGLLQKHTQFMDGVPAVTQCPIAPGQSYTYKFRADLYGTSWYHSHYSAQYAGGALGAMIIYGPEGSLPYDVDLGPVLINDWFHASYYDLVEQVMAPISAGELPPQSQNSLINGKMNYPCASASTYPCTPNAGISKFKLQSGKSYRLRVINAGAEGMQKFSIDGYNMTVIANDFVPIKPYVTDVLTLGVGQRSDVILYATGKPTDSMWMRANIGISAFQGGCSLPDGTSPEGVAAMYYESANTNSVPTTTSQVSQSAINTCTNDPLTDTEPLFPIPAITGATTQTIDIVFKSNGTNELFYVNNSTFRADYNTPVLLSAHNGMKTYPSEANVYDFSKSKAVTLIVYNYAPTGAHPMHMHGHNVQVWAVGTGTWNGVITNPSNPQRRDVQLLPNAVSATEPGYIVVSFETDNPGVWPFHCHIAWHVSAGLYMNILENRKAIRHDTSIPTDLNPICTSWTAWTAGKTVNEIDSGL